VVPDINALSIARNSGDDATVLQNPKFGYTSDLDQSKRCVVERGFEVWMRGAKVTGHPGFYQNSWATFTPIARGRLDDSERRLPLRVAGASVTLAQRVLERGADG